MEKRFPRIKIFNVSVREVDGKVIFLRKLVPGGSEHSFGIHVAKLAGMPAGIVKRAGVILHQLEQNMNPEHVGKGVSAGSAPDKGVQLSFFNLEDPVLCQVRDEVLHLDIDHLTPLEALNKLNEIKHIVKGK